MSSPKISSPVASLGPDSSTSANNDPSQHSAHRVHSVSVRLGIMRGQWPIRLPDESPANSQRQAPDDPRGKCSSHGFGSARSREASDALMLYRSWFGSPTAWVRVAVNPGHEEVFPCTSTLMPMPVP